MYDGSEKTFEMAVRKSSTDVIAVIEGKIMLLMQEQPGKEIFPSLPGGGVEDGETPQEAATRELLLETGYAGDLTLVDEFFGHALFFHESVFVAKNCRKIAEPHPDEGERIKVTFTTFEEFLQLCRDQKFAVPIGLKFRMYEALVDEKKKLELKLLLGV